MNRSLDAAAHLRCLRVMIAALLATLCLGLGCPARAEEMPPIVMAEDASSGPADAYTRRLMRLIYGEAFKRLKLRLEIVVYPTARVAVMLEQGRADGLMARARAYGEAFPQMVRVDEPVLHASFALYTARPELQLSQVQDLASGAWRVDYRNGVIFCENQLKRLVPPKQLSAVTSTLSGLQKLLLDRADLFCDVDVAVLNILYGSELKHGGTLRKVIEIGDPAPLYPYLQGRHAELAVRLAAVLKQMKREGLLERYRLEVLRQLGR